VKQLLSFFVGEIWSLSISALKRRPNICTTLILSTASVCISAQNLTRIRIIVTHKLAAAANYATVLPNAYLGTRCLTAFTSVNP